MWRIQPGWRQLRNDSEVGFNRTVRGVCSSRDCPANFDIAYEEGMSSVLLKQAEEDVKKDESLALALNFSAQQKKVLEQCKVKPTI